MNRSLSSLHPKTPVKIKMRVSELFTFGLLHTAAAVASTQAKKKDVTPSKRPQHAVSPYSPGKALPASPERTKTCIVQGNGDGTDDAANVLKAIKDCNNGGHVIFPKDQKFTIGTALDLTFLNSIDLGMFYPLRLKSSLF